MIQRLNIKGVPIQIQDLIFTNQRNEQRKRGCYGCGELGHFVEVCPNKPTPKTKTKACKNQALTSIRSWDDSSSEEEDHHKRRGHKQSSSSTSHVCLMARGNKSLSLVIVIVIVMMSYLLMMKLCNKILTLLKFALVNKKSLKIKKTR